MFTHPFIVRSGDVEWGRENGGRCLRHGSNKAMIKSRIEIEKVLEAKTNKENKKLDLTYLGAGRWVYWVE